MHVPSPHEVETFSGRFVDVAQPDPSTIVLEDIAWALSQTCRYGGHCQTFYSVAEHAVFVSKRLERKGMPVATQLAGLHHDDSEYVLSDIPRPMKPLLGKVYEAMTTRVDLAIVPALELPFQAKAFHDPVVKEADTWALLVEARYLLLSQGKGWYEGRQTATTWNLEDQPSRIVTPDYWLGGLTSKDAYAKFLERHAELTKGS